MYSGLVKNADWLVDSHENGYKKVKAGNYAFVAETGRIDYELKKDCSLQEIEGISMPIFYGIVIQKGKGKYLLSQPKPRQNPS